MSREFNDKFIELTAKSEPFAVATVVRARRPTSAKPGSKAIITAEGTLVGWVGGSCAQPAVIEQAMVALNDGKPRLLKLGPDDIVSNEEAEEGTIHYAHTCQSHGALDIFVEPYLPRAQLVIFGHEPTAQVLAKLAKLLDFRVIVVDPLATREAFPEADAILDGLDSSKVEITSHSYVVIATHQTYPGESDEKLLEQVITSKAPYVSLVASKRRGRIALQYLAQRRISQDHLTKLKSPAGIDIHAVTPNEIALSIIAEIVSVMRGEKIQLLIETERFGSQLEQVLKPATGQTQSQRSDDSLAEDPVCHMEVNISTAQYSSIYRGVSFYFCSSGCKRKFESKPDKYGRLH